MALDEEAKAAQEIAKTAGKAVDAATTLGKYLSKYIQGPIEQTSSIIEDTLKYKRWERQVRLMKRADDFLRAQGLGAPTRPVPVKIMLPLAQNGGLEDDDALQDLWACLLAQAANAKSDIEVRRSYIDILQQLTSLDVLVFQKIYSVPITEADRVIETVDLPTRVVFGQQGNISTGHPSDSVQLSLANLARLGLIDADKNWVGPTLYGHVFQTILGRKFFKAVQPP